MIDNRRIFPLNTHPFSPGPVVYWMSRDQRVQDNWALLRASGLALEHKTALLVLFCLTPSYLNASAQHYQFMLAGLERVRSDLRKKNIPFLLTEGNPEETVPEILSITSAGALVTDFNPLKISRSWKDSVNRKIHIPFFEVDAHNIVPCRIVSQKQETGARTLRPKISRLLPEFLTGFPPLPDHPWSIDLPDFPQHTFVKADPGTGEAAAREQLRNFLDEKLQDYPEKRNHPELDGQSGLSPYLHFGQISAQRIALEVINHQADPESKASFLEELIVRRELSDNFCFHNPDYDSFNGFPAWARRTLDKHRNDLREHLYDLNVLENAETADEAWNAAQRQMVRTGKMHGYMRMYWAKKILEWTTDPEEALDYCIFLNDKYSLDGRDPNGYAGISWSVGGTHDRPWAERNIFGQIRYMNFNGLARKFKIQDYIRQHSA